jgi:tetratricopeptide (TPR) repeat protein
MSEHELWNELGNLYFMSGSYEQAIHAYHRSIQMDNTYGKPYSNLAQTYVLQGKYDEAVKLFRRSLDLLVDNKEKAISWNRLGKVYRHLKDYQQAVIAFQHSDEFDPECKEDSEEPGQMLYASSDLSIPLQECSASLPDLKMDTASVLNQTPEEPAPETTSDAYTFTDLPQLEESIPIDPEATSLTNWSDVNADYQDDDWSPAFSNDTEIYLSTSDADGIDEEFAIPEEALIDPSQQLEENMSSAELFEPAPVELASWKPVETQSFSRSSGKSVDLRGTEYQLTKYEKDLMVDVDERPAASILPAEKDPSPSIQAEEMPVPIKSRDNISSVNSHEITALETEILKYKRVVQINDRNASAWDALGTLYKSAGLYKEAILAHQQAISIDSSRASYYHHLGLAFAGAGRAEDAISVFQKVIELDPDHYLAHATLGGYYRKLGLEELAQKHIGKAMRNIYDNESEYNRACLAAICGNLEQAIDLLQIALEKKQTYVEWIIHDPDLDFIREDSRFKELISSYNS